MNDTPAHLHHTHGRGQDVHGDAVPRLFLDTRDACELLQPDET